MPGRARQANVGDLAFVAQVDQGAERFLQRNINRGGQPVAAEAEVSQTADIGAEVACRILDL